MNNDAHAYYNREPFNGYKVTHKCTMMLVVLQRRGREEERGKRERKGGIFFLWRDTNNA